MMDILGKLNDKVLRDIEKCKKGKLGKRAGQNWTICKDLECRVFYFEPKNRAIDKPKEVFNNA
jgi:hypothetical protein